MRFLSFSPILEKDEIKPKELDEYIDDKDCILCGNKAQAGLLCGRCQNISTLPTMSLIDIPYILVFISAILSFIYLSSTDIFFGEFSLINGQREELGFLFIMLSLIGSFIFIIERRDHIIISRNLLSTLTILAILFSPISFLPLFLLGPGPIEVLLPLAAISMAIIIVSFRVKKGEMRRKIHHIVIFIGSILTTFGLYLSIKGVDPDLVLWFLSGEHITIIGLSMIALSTYGIVNRYPSGTRVAFTLITLAASSSLFFISGLTISIWGSTGALDETLFLFSFAVLVQSIISRIDLRVKDAMMISKLREIEASLSRAVDMIENRKNFYALQQFDHAMDANPVNDLGQQFMEGNTISKVERKLAMDELSFQPTEYEISYNEKAKILSSQGRFTEAVKKYNEAIRKRPDYIQTYLELSMLLSSIPGKDQESRKQLKFFITEKILYLRRMHEEDVSSEVIWWMIRSFGYYLTSLDMKRELLGEMSKDGDIWAYFSLGRDRNY